MEAEKTQGDRERKRRGREGERQKCGSRKRLRLHKSLVEIHSMSSSPFSSPRDKRHSPLYSVSPTNLLSHRHSDTKLI